MNERVKIIRKKLNMSQKEFGEHIGLKPNSISDIETGKNALNDQNIKSICREFNVNEEWLRTGNGDPIKPFPEEDEVAAYVSELLEDDGSNPVYTLIKEIMHTYSELDAKSQEVLKNSCEKLIENLSKKKEG